MKQATTYLITTIIAICTVARVSAATIPVSLTGLESGDKAVVSISSNEYLDTKIMTSDGSISFEDVPTGRHFVSVVAEGYTISNAVEVLVSSDGKVLPPVTIKLAITKNTDSEDFHFIWSEDGTVAGYTASCYVNTPLKVEFLGKQIVPSDVPSQHNLLSYFQIILSDEDQPWTEEYAYRLWQTMQTFEIASQDAEPGYKPERPHNKFILTDELLADDLNVEVLESGDKIVKISKDAFAYANPYYVNLEGVKGRFYSKRLHHAMTKYVTDYGYNVDLANHILRERFGCEILAINYEALTAGITDEPAEHFQMFKPSEIVALINMFEEMPEGFHKVDHLKYLLRRLDTHPHPIYPEAAAVSWPVEVGYIEFMEKAFGGNNEHFDTQRLILHEKSHFLWAFTFSDEVKNKWIEIGGWYELPGGGWATTDQVDFVSQYAHDVSPDEDMAESLAYYLKDPEWFKSRALPKYEFVRNVIMHGTRYISQIPEQFTFEVFNLWPDYDYPGKITKIEVQTKGTPDEDKTVIVDLWLNHVEGCQDGAMGGWTRIFSPMFYDQNGVKHYHSRDLAFEPVDGDLFHLRGICSIGKHCKSGDWTAYSISLSDDNGNARFSSSANDYVWKLQINNSDEDLWSPEYVPNSLKYEVYDDKDWEGHDIQVFRPMFQAYDDRIITGSYIGIAVKDSETYSFGSWGDLLDASNPKGGWIDSKLEIPPYFATGDYFVGSIAAYDLAGNGCWVLFPDCGEPIKYQHIITPDPDIKVPEVDLNRVAVYAEPTNPDAPNGETRVSISMFVRDDKSGVEGGSFTLRDPQGGQYDFGFDMPYGHSYWDGEERVKEWVYINANCTLAAGSVPGIWGISEIHIDDRARNARTFNLVETLIFEPDENESYYVLFAEMNENNMLSIHLDSSEGALFGFEYRIIHEGTGKEISGETFTDEKGIIRRKRITSTNDINVDISSMPDGNLIVITNIYGEDGEIQTSKSARVKKNTYVGLIVEDDDIQDLNIVGRTVTLTSRSHAYLPISTIDGRVELVEVFEGKNDIMLPSAGFYIIQSHKVIVK